MAFDVYDIFDKCVKNSFDGGEYFDLNKFVKEVKKHGDRGRTAMMCRRILGEMSDDHDDFLWLTARMVAGDYDDNVVLIKHSRGKFEVSGMLPDNAEIILRGESK